MKSLTASCNQTFRNKFRSFSIHFISVAVCFLLITTGLSSQTLFTYGKHAVSKEEFLNAYNKNNGDSSSHPLTYEEYLELYSRFKIKVQAALDAGMDTTTDQRNELEAFKYQLAENYLKDDASIKTLVEEAFERSQKDINISYIYAPVYSNDSAEVDAARNKINESYAELQKGTPFETVADATIHGSVGFITVFVLPYVIENIAYTTPEGKYSAPFKTSSGFYIIKNNKERKAVGNIRVAQILLAFHPGMTADAKKQLKERADSLHNDLLEGGIFSDSAKLLSNDNLTFQNGGEMPAFGLGQFDTSFTNAAFALQKDGEISSPVLTTYGYHILKRLQKIDVTNDSTNAANMEMLKEKVLQSDRMQAGKSMLAKTIRQKIEKDASPADLASDSAILDFYRRHLENYNKEFAVQIKEFREGNLLFGIMQKKIWDAAAEDSAALRNYYNANKSKYNWEISADAVIITCADPHYLDSAQISIKNNPASWRELAEKSNGMIQADSGRFELGQIPVTDRTNFTEGLITAPVTNEQDSSKTFAYIIRLHNEKEPKRFEDARGSVINDYQVYLEEQWIADLKKKYPIRVNKKVFRTLPARN